MRQHLDSTAKPFMPFLARMTSTRKPRRGVGDGEVNVGTFQIGQDRVGARVSLSTDSVKTLFKRTISSDLIACLGNATEKGCLCSSRCHILLRNGSFCAFSGSRILQGVKEVRSGSTTMSTYLRVESALVEEYQKIHKAADNPVVTDFSAKVDSSGNADAAEASSKQPTDDKLAELFAAIHALKSPRTALCFSGGGIRSATFGLGLIQGMARHNLLGSFDYLSTVSGGGYIGSWLSAWINRPLPGTDGTAGRIGLEGVVSELNRSSDVVPTGGKTAVLTTPVSKIDPEPTPVRHLRAYSNYLSPQLGLFTADAWSIIATYLRNLLLNWLVLIPFLVGVLLVPRLALTAVRWHSTTPWLMSVSATLAFLVAVFGLYKVFSYTDFHRPSRWNELKKKIPSLPPNNERRFLLWAFAPLQLATAAAVLFGAWAPRSQLWTSIGECHWFGAWTAGVEFGILGAAIVFGSWAVHLKHVPGGNRWKEAAMLLLVGFTGGVAFWWVYEFVTTVSWRPQAPAVQHVLYTGLAGPLLLCLHFAFSSILIGLVSGFTDDVDREWWARAAAWVALAAVGWSMACGVVLVGPYALIWALKNAPVWVASAGGISGLYAVIVGKSGLTAARKKSSKSGGTNLAVDIGTRLAAPLFITLLLVGIALGTAVLAFPTGFRSSGVTGEHMVDWHSFWTALLDRYFNAIDATPVKDLATLGGCALFFSLVMSVFVNVNKFSMHAMYRNRLIRAYLGASRKRRTDQFADFQEEDNPSMTELLVNGEVQRPFHVVNTTLNVTSTSNLDWQDRKAMSFTISPLHGGNMYLGYRRVDEYSSTTSAQLGFKWLHGNVGKKSLGLTLGTAMTISGAAVSPNMGYHSAPLVAFLLTFFNVRLGWWLGNPGRAGQNTYRLSSPTSALRALLDELLGRSSDRDKYVMLSDGGHFENLGLYEMVLRRCRVIVVSDAGEDPAYSFEDLSNALTKIHVDLGVPIDFVGRVPISKFAPGNKDPAPGKYCALAVIRYSAIDTVIKDGERVAAPDGVLIYLKPTLINQEPADLLHYARSNPNFPHEPTLDEFYSESQFESYRLLGEHVIDFMCKTSTAKAGDMSEPFGRLCNFAEHAYAHAYPPPETGSTTDKGSGSLLRAALDKLPPPTADGIVDAAKRY